MDQETFDATVERRYFEDYEPGSRYTYGPVTVAEADIVEFATRYDPQYLHIDPAAATAGPFHGLIASGWHTAAIMMRLYVDHYLSKVASLASPGIQNLNWARPVRPGDQLSLHVQVLDTKVSQSKPDRGIVTTRADLTNQHHDTALSLVFPNFLLRRPPRP